MPNKPELIDFIRSQGIAKDFSDSELQLIYDLDIIKVEVFKTNEIIFEEGSTSKEFYLIYEGEVQISKWDSDRKYQHLISKLSVGQMFGEMAFLDGQPRSSEVRAAKDTTLIKVPCEIFETENVEIKNIYNKIIKNIATVNLNRLRQSNQNYVQSLRKQLEALNLRNNFGLLFIISIIVIGFNNILASLIQKFGIDTYNAFASWTILLVIATPFFFLIKKFGYPLSEYGVTLKNWKESVKGGLVTTGIGVALVMILYELYSAFNPASHSLYYVITHPKRAFDFPVIIYFFHSYIQEFIGRGVLQTSFNKFMGSTNPYKAILVTSTMFGMAHVERGLVSGAVAFLASYVFGFLYIRTYNLIGVTILHYVAGLIAIHYLGIV